MSQFKLYIFFPARKKKTNRTPLVIKFKAYVSQTWQFEKAVSSVSRLAEAV